MSTYDGKHRIEWTHDRDTIVGNLVCQSGENALCRLWCSDGDESCAVLHGAKAGDECTNGHTLRSLKTCSVVDWITDGGVAESYDGEDGATVHDGPVGFTWDGDIWLWHYLDEQVTS